MREPKPLISAATQGELRSLILQFGWGKARIDQALFLLSYFTNFPIDSVALYESYAAIDAFSRSKGVTMGKNDLWIAATASVTGATLLTTDADFDHLPADLLLRERVLVQTA